MILLNGMGYKTVLFHSFRYSHAMVGMAVPGAVGVYKEINGIKYYFAETTYPGWRIGQTPPQYSNTDYWVPLHIGAEIPENYGPGTSRPERGTREERSNGFNNERDRSEQRQTDSLENEGEARQREEERQTENQNGNFRDDRSEREENQERDSSRQDK